MKFIEACRELLEDPELSAKKAVFLGRREGLTENKDPLFREILKKARLEVADAIVDDANFHILTDYDEVLMSQWKISDNSYRQDFTLYLKDEEADDDEISHEGELIIQFHPNSFTLDEDAVWVTIGEDHFDATSIGINPLFYTRLES